MTPNLLISQPSHITEHSADIISQSQHPDTHLPICLSAWRVSATLWIRSLDDSLSLTAQLVRTRSGQQPVTSNTSLPDSRARWGVTKDTIDKAFIWSYCCNFAVTSRKAPAFLQGLLQFNFSWSGRGDSNSRPSPWQFYNGCFSSSQDDHSHEIEGNLDSP